MTYEPTDKPYSVDGVTFYKEQQSPAVIHTSAKFFAFVQPTNDDVYFTKYKDQNTHSISYIEPGWGHDSNYRVRLSLPAGMEKWSRLRYTFPPEAIAPYLSDITIKGERAHWYPDFGATVQSLLVTERAKQAILDLDPGNHYFQPARVTIAETGKPLPEQRFFWKPRNVMRFDHRAPSRNLFRPPFRPGGAFWNAQIAWELKFNEALRDYVSRLPFWALDQDQFNFGMSPDVFRSLKAAGFTGLIEIVGDNYYADDFDRNANVGHF